MEEKCGCYSKVFVETNAEKIETFRVDVFYCPLHAAAPLLLEALKEASQHFYGDMAPDFDYFSEHMYKAHKIIKAAIAAAEKKE